MDEKARSLDEVKEIIAGYLKSLHAREYNPKSKEIKEFVDLQNPMITALSSEERRILESPEGRTAGEGFEALVAEILVGKNEAVTCLPLASDSFAAVIKELPKGKHVFKPTDKGGFGLDLIVVAKQGRSIIIDYGQVKMGDTPFALGSPQVGKETQKKGNRNRDAHPIKEDMMAAMKIYNDALIEGGVEVNKSGATLYTTRKVSPKAKAIFDSADIVVHDKKWLWKNWSTRIKNYAEQIMDDCWFKP